MNDRNIPARTLQLVERTKNFTDKKASANDDHLMPDLIAPVVNTFTAPRQTLTTRGIARTLRLTNVAVETALFRELFRELRELRGLVAMSRRAA